MSPQVFAVSAVVVGGDGRWVNRLYLIEATSLDHAEAHVFAEAKEQGREVLSCAHLSVGDFMAAGAAA